MTEDVRLYLKNPSWQPAVKVDDSRAFCHRQREDEPYYHRIVYGELYMTDGVQNLCLSCAVKLDIITRERPELKPPRDLFGIYEESPSPKKS